VVTAMVIDPHSPNMSFRTKVLLNFTSVELTKKKKKQNKTKNKNNSTSISVGKLPNRFGHVPLHQNWTCTVYHLFIDHMQENFNILMDSLNFPLLPCTHVTSVIINHSSIVHYILSTLCCCS
jgi:hypothetical protein